MKINIRHFKGIERADFEASRIALVCGANGAGKSSICQAVAAALTGVPLPFISAKKGNPFDYNNLLTKSIAGSLVKGGSTKGQVKVAGKNGYVGVKWPDADVISDGSAPSGSPYAAYLVDPLSLDDKAFGALLSQVMNMEPTKEDLSNALKDEGVSEKKIEKLWERLESDGWDTTHKAAAEHGAKLKGQWETYAGGEKYGGKKADGWIPEGWQEDLDEQSLDALDSALAKAREDLEKVVVVAAFSEAEVADLEEKAGKAEAMIEAVTEACKARDEAKQAHADAVQERADLGADPSESNEMQFPCPHCAEPVSVTAVRGQGVTTYDLKKPGKKPTKKEIDEWRKATASLDGKIANLNADYNAKARAVFEAEDASKRAREAVRALQDAKAGQGGGGGEAEINQAREAVRIAEERLTMFNSRNSAATAHKGVKANQILVDALAPKGVRAQVLNRALRQINKELATLCLKAKWEPVVINDDMTVEYAGRPLVLMSGGERYRARATIQTLIALKDGSGMLVFDEADILDDAGEKGLIMMIHHTKLPALIGMKKDSVEDIGALDLGKKGVGETYWVEGGALAPMGDWGE